MGTEQQWISKPNYEEDSLRGHRDVKHDICIKAETKPGKTLSQATSKSQGKYWGYICAI